MAAPTTIREIGPRTGRNRRELAFVTGTGNIQDLTTYGTDLMGNASPLQGGSTAEELAADGLTVLKLHEFVNDKWAFISQIN